MEWHEIELINTISLILRITALVFSSIFVVRYARRPWRSLPEGQHLMGFSLVIAAFMLWSVIGTLLAWLDPTPPEVRPDGDWPGREWVATILFGFVAWYMYQRNKLLEPENKARELKQAEDDLHDDRVNNSAPEEK